MDDSVDIDRILSDGFEGQENITYEENFTKNVMSVLPRRGISYGVKVLIISLCFIAALSVSLFEYKPEELYALQEEVLVEGMWSVQYWIVQLSFIV